MLFTVVKYKNESANVISKNLQPISIWAYNWKKFFNAGPSKPAQEVLFSRKKKTKVNPTITLNNVQVERMSYQKHLGILRDEKPNFKQHFHGAI